MKILVTGGDGFIGSHLCEALRKELHEVVVLDNHETSFSTTCFGNDVCNYNTVEKMIQGCGFVFHLAHVVGVAMVRSRLWDTVRYGLEGTLIVVDVCVDYGVPMLLASSSEVYGPNRDHSFPWYSMNSRMVYPVTKLAQELIVRTDEELDWRIARIFNTIGPRQLADYGMVVPSFVRAALRGDDLIVHGSGTQVRWFAHVKDTVAQLIDLMYQSSGVVRDVGDSIECSINDLAELIIKMTGSNSKIAHVAKPFGDSYGDLYRVKPVVGFKSTKTIEGLLEDVITWWKQNPGLWEV